MAETRIQAEQDYMAGMKYKDIAEKYGVSLNTVKSWKQRHGWVRNKGAPITKSVHTKKRDAPKQEPVILSDDLTDKQRLFCIYYLKYFNATKAYQKAYGCAYSTAMVEGHRHLRNPKINAEIDRLKEEQANELKLDVQDVIQKYIDIAFADITDFVEFGFKEVTTKEVVGVDKDGVPIINENTDGFNFVDIKESAEVDGTLITEVKQGKDGVSIKLSDRMKALAALEKYVGFMSEEQKARMELIKSKIPNKDQTNINAQITALADLINNPAPDRVIDDD